MQRLLVIRGGALGDLIVTLPALGALRQAFPEASLELLGHPPRAVFAHHPQYAARVIDVERWELYRLFQPQPSLSAEMAAFFRRFTHIVSYVPASDDTLARNLQRYSSGEVHTWRPHPPAGVHITTHLLHPVMQMAPQPYNASPQVYLDPAAVATAADFWQTAGLPADGVIAWHPGSGGRAKLWPRQGWHQLIHWAARHGLPGLHVRGPAEEIPLDDLPAWPCAANLPLPLLAALLARCHLVVSHDSGISHLAAAVGTSTLSLFGPTDPMVWGPRSPRACVLRPPLREPLTLENLPPAVVIQVLQAVYAGTLLAPPAPGPCTIVTPEEVR